MRFLGRGRDFGRRAPAQGPSVQVLSVRVAMAASAIVGIAYIVIAAAVLSVVTNNLTGDVDQHLKQITAQAPDRNGPGVNVPGGNPFVGFDPSHQDLRGLWVLAWQVDAGGTATGLGPNDLTLPVEDRKATAPTTVTINGGTYRIAGQSTGDGWIVVAQSMDGVASTQSTLIVAEMGIGCMLLVVVFLGALVIGRQVALPVERSRQRQLEFTADASHELRTPLSVIEAHATLALARGRDPSWDQAAFGRIDDELKRTRRLVDDMLWLARFDSTGWVPEAEPVDVRVLAAQTADRFGAIAESRKQTLALDPASSEGDAIVTAPPEWLDRLIGVLIDNACKYSPEGGSVSVHVASEGRRIRLTVDDSGPGIPPDERGRVFDRFHRATDSAGGAGLGLAIADAIAHATGGRWHIGTSPAGGASVSVSWPRSVTS